MRENIKEVLVLGGKSFIYGASMMAGICAASNLYETYKNRQRNKLIKQIDKSLEKIERLQNESKPKTKWFK